MLISVIICTYGRAESLGILLGCLAAQEHKDLEILVVDGNPAPSPAAAVCRQFRVGWPDRIGLRIIASPRGLTRQRNMGLREARGQLLAFLDDDVRMAPTFFGDANRLFERADFE